MGAILSGLLSARLRVQAEGVTQCPRVGLTGCLAEAKGRAPRGQPGHPRRTRPLEPTSRPMLGSEGRKATDRKEG